MRKAILITLCVMLPICAMAAPAGQSLGNFSAWASFLAGSKVEPICYMSLNQNPKPAPKTKKNKKSTAPERGTSYLMITHRPAENSKDVVSYSAGYNFKTGSNVQITIGGQTYSMFTNGDTAWVADAATDKKIAQAITKSQNIRIIGINPSGQHITDNLKSAGADKAYYAISKACGYNVESKKKPEAQKSQKQKSQKPKKQEPIKKVKRDNHGH